VNDLLVTGILSWHLNRQEANDERGLKKKPI